MTSGLTKNKLTEPQRMQVFALLARGDTISKVNDFLQSEYDITLAPSTISDMKKRHADTIASIRATVQESIVTDAEAIMNKSRKLLSRKLDKADADMSELEELDEQYRNNEIDYKEYDRKRRTLLKVSIAELAQVSKAMHDQSKPDEGDKPASSVNSTNTEALLAAIKNGDTVELQRIILNPAEAGVK